MLVKTGKNGCNAANRPHKADRTKQAGIVYLGLGMWSGGSLGTVCIYEASSQEAIQEHAAAADLPKDI